MNPQHEVERMLREHDAVLVRQRNHFVYRLPNGHNFVLAKTPSDHRGAKNNLSDLRRALSVRNEAKERSAMNEPQTEQAPTPAIAAVPAAAVVVASAPDTLRSRIEAAIAREEGKQERLLAQAQQIERYAQMLKTLLPFADDPATEEVLKALLPAAPTAVAQLPETGARLTSKPPAPPDHVTARVQVTRQLVLAATQTFEDPFTINDLLELMVGDRQIDQPERVRVRTAIAQAIIALAERGEVLKSDEVRQRRQGVWMRARLNGGARAACQ